MFYIFGVKKNLSFYKGVYINNGDYCILGGVGKLNGYGIDDF